MKHVSKKNPSGALFLDYLRQAGLLKIYQYLDGTQFYSQTTEGVSNIFLVNDQFRSVEEL